MKKHSFRPFILASTALSMMLCPHSILLGVCDTSAEAARTIPSDSPIVNKQIVAASSSALTIVSPVNEVIVNEEVRSLLGRGLFVDSAGSGSVETITLNAASEECGVLLGTAGGIFLGKLASGSTRIDNNGGKILITTASGSPSNAAILISAAGTSTEEIVINNKKHPTNNILGEISAGNLARKGISISSNVDRLTINNEGLISGSMAIDLPAAGRIKIDNEASGSILGTSTSAVIDASATIPTATFELDNSGLVSVKLSVSQPGTLAIALSSAFGPITIKNSGTIKGKIGTNDGTSLHTGKMELTNSGTIVGDVYLGMDADSFIQLDTSSNITPTTLADDGITAIAIGTGTIYVGTSDQTIILNGPTTLPTLSPSTNTWKLHLKKDFTAPTGNINRLSSIKATDGARLTISSSTTGNDDPNPIRLTLGGQESPTPTSGVLVPTSDLSNLITLDTGGGIIDTGSAAFTLSGVIADPVGVTSNFGRLTKSGSGTLTLSVANSYKGQTHFDEGVVSIDADNKLGTPPSSPNANLVFDGGVLEATAGFNLNANRLVTLHSSGGTFKVRDAGETLGIAGIISDASGETGALTKTGAGTLELSGDNDYSGITTISAGTLKLSSTGRIEGSSEVVVDGTFDISAVGTTKGGVTDAALIKALSGSGTGEVILGSTDTKTLIIDQSIDTTFAGKISGNGNLIKSDTGKLTLSDTNQNPNAYSGTTTFNGGTISISTEYNLGAVPGSAAENLIFGGGTFEATAGFNLNANRLVTLHSSGGTFKVRDAGETLGIAGIISDASGETGALTKTGAGTLELSGDNDYSGITTISAGTLKLSSTGRIEGSSEVVVDGTFDISTAGTTKGGVTDAALIKALSGSGTGEVILGSTDTKTLIIDQSIDTTFAGKISGNGNLIKSDTGKLTLSDTNQNPNAYSGTTTFNGGTISISTEYNLGAVPGSAAENLIFGGGTFEATAGFNLNANRLVTLHSSGGTFKVRDAGETLGIAGIMSDGSGAGTLTKIGAGILELSGDNDYSCATAISADILKLLNLGHIDDSSDVVASSIFDISRTPSRTSIYLS